MEHIKEQVKIVCQESLHELMMSRVRDALDAIPVAPNFRAYRLTALKQVNEDIQRLLESQITMENISSRINFVFDAAISLLRAAIVMEAANKGRAEAMAKSHLRTVTYNEEY